MQFRKNPVTIEARQMPLEPSQELVREIAIWMVDNEYDGSVDYEVDEEFQHEGLTLPDHGANYLEIDTLEGVMSAGLGDWIIQGVQGEFYPCKQDIFAQTYTAADEPVRVPVGQDVVFTQGDADAVRITVKQHVVQRRVPRAGGEGFILTPRSAQLVSLNAQKWVHAEDGEVV